MSGAWVYVVSLILLFGNAFFVGAEFAAMTVRRSSLQPLADAGSRRAATSIEAVGRLGSMLTTAQLGITVCSVGLGALAEAALHHLFEPIFAAWGMERPGRAASRSRSPCSSCPTCMSWSGR